MKDVMLVVHVGTGTIIDARECVTIVSSADYYERESDCDIIELAAEHGQPLTVGGVA